jgi:hypothetical protein
LGGDEEEHLQFGSTPRTVTGPQSALPRVHFDDGSVATFKIGRNRVSAARLF